MLKKEKKTKEMSLLPCWLAGYIKRDVSSNLTNEHQEVGLEMKRIEPLVAHVGKLIYFAALPNTDVKKCQLCLKSLEFLEIFAAVV